MKPVEFEGQTLVIAKDQPQYQPLPAFQHFDKSGRVTFCWRLTWRERLKLLFTGTLWHQVLTFEQPLQPQKLLVDKPEMVRGEKYDPSRRLRGAVSP